MDIIKYSVDDTLVISFGKPSLEINKNQTKLFDVNNKVYKNICIHLFEDIPEDDYDLFAEISQTIKSCTTDEKIKKKSLRVLCVLIFYVYNNWKIINKREGIVENKNTQYDLHNMIPFITENHRISGDICICEITCHQCFYRNS